MTGSAGVSAARASRYRWTTAFVCAPAIPDLLGTGREGEVGPVRSAGRPPAVQRITLGNPREGLAANGRRLDRPRSPREVILLRDPSNGHAGLSCQHVLISGA